MLKKLAAWVLNNYLGKYVENLNTEQVSFGLLRGEVELENLPLKKDAIRLLDGSIEIRAGFLSKIHLKIPVTHLMSEPWVISIEKLYLILGPISPYEYDKEKDQEAIQERKMGELDRIEAAWRSEHEAKQEESYYASSYSSWVSYGTSFVTSIIENLQLNINDVHVRFEGDVFNVNSPFACGITIESLVAQRTNDKWLPVGLTNHDDTKRKVVSLKNMSIYWQLNSDVIGFLPLPDLEERMQRLSNIMFKGECSDYILEPISVQARLLQNSNPEILHSRSSPRFVCDLLLDKFPISLREDQYDSAINWLYDFERLNKMIKYRKWRPQVEVSGHVKEWWRFIAQPFREECHEKCIRQNWTYVLTRAKNNVLYVKAYAEYLINPVTCPAALKKHKDEMEQTVPLEELKVLCLLAMERVSALEKEEHKKTVNCKPESGVGILQRWFPLWRGWYPTATMPSAEITDTVTETSKDSLGALEAEQNFEQEILGALANSVQDDCLFRRDAVFAKVNFTLHRAVFSVYSHKYHHPLNSLSDNIARDGFKKTMLFELVFADVTAGLELRPRSSSTMLVISLGGLSLQDRSLEGSSYPMLIVSQNRDVMDPAPPPSTVSSLASKFPFKFSSFISPFSSTNAVHTIRSKDPLFHLTYETKPSNYGAHTRLNVKSESLDIVYNFGVWKSIMEFFIKPHKKYHSSHGRSLQLSAKYRYEKFKQQTTKEILKNCGHILDTEQPFTLKNWDIHLDISAPRIIFPENLFDAETTVVVCDLGRLQFCTISNNSDNLLEKSADSDDEDFRTPCSTPPDTDYSSDMKHNFNPILPVIKEDIGNCDITEEAFHSGVYDRYTLDFRDLQILVCDAKNIINYAYVQGTSTMHLLDKFSISLQLERRVIHTLDPQWPGVTLYGTLPKIVVHVTEQKIQALRTCFGQQQSLFDHIWLSSDDSIMENPDVKLEEKTEDTNDHPESILQEYDAEVRLLMMQFNIGEMCLDVQSRGRSIAELQVMGIKSTFTKRPYDTSVTLTVHSLLIVDALQTFGPDFELLVASHRNISMDSMSGSMRDSEPNSPTSPASPTSSRSVCTSPVAINAALRNLQLKNSSIQREASPSFVSVSKASLPPYFLSEKRDSEALISVEFVVVRPHISNQMCLQNAEVTKIATVQFNTLDIIANQETLVELIGFIKHVLPHDEPSYFGGVSPIDKSKGDNKDHLNKELDNGKNVCIEITFDFNRLSVLLLRCVDIDGTMCAQKIATATMTGACIHATAGHNLKIRGSLGGLQIYDTVVENAKHSRILSVGYDPLLAYPVSIVDELNADVYAGSTRNVNSYDAMQAFDFVVTISETEDMAETKMAFLTMKMASVFYIHSSRFLRDLASCVSEFKQYAVKFASSIRTAATEMAIGIVGRRMERPSSLGSNSMPEGIFSNLSPPSPKNDQYEIDNSCNGMDVTIKLDVVLQSPIIILPESSTSSIVLVAHLGRITVKNEWHNTFEDPNFSHCCLTRKHHDKMEEISVDIREINLYSLDVDKNSCTKTKKCKVLHPQDYICTEKGFPILHDTMIELTINHYIGHYTLESTQSESFMKDCKLKNKASSASLRHLYNVYGCVSNSLKVSLSRKHYNQILKTFNSFSVIQDIAVPNHLDNVDKNECLLTKENYYSRSLGFAIGIVFKLSEFTLELFDELRDMERGLVSLSFQDIITKYEKQEYYVSNLEITLKSLFMEDLLQELNSKHRFLMLSSSTANLKPIASKHLSSSCPDVTMPHVLLFSHHSLPDKLNTENVFQNFQRTKEKKMYGGHIHFTRLPSSDSCPQTPPPSPLHMYQPSEEALVHIKILFVDSASEEFAKKYNSTNQLVDVNFNSLDVIVNLPSWVHVFDFFGLNNSSYSSNASAASINPSLTKSCDKHQTLIQGTKTEMELQVRSLSMMFKKDEYELAKANVSKLECRISKWEDNFSVRGRLGRMSFLDLSPHGHLYKEKFTTIGNEALHFCVKKYGSCRQNLVKECDASVQLKMFSVFYIHSQRFYDEVMAFFQHFSKLQEILEKVRAASSGAKVNDPSLRESRVRMNVCMQSCIMVLPISSWSTEVLVAEMGHLTLTNKFRISESEETIKENRIGVFMKSPESFKGIGTQGIKPSTEKKLFFSDRKLSNYIKGNLENVQHKSCLLDVINISLVDIDLYTAERIDRKTGNEQNTLEFSSFAIQRKGRSLLTEKCKLDLQVERNLDKEFNHTVANVSVRGILSAIHGIINVDQYKIIRGFFSHNLGEQHEEFHTTGVSSSEKGSINEAWITMWLQLDLINVTLEFVDKGPLAKVNFIKSRLTYERASNNALDVDLVSREILVSDTRFLDWPSDSKPNVFSNILQPTKGSKTDLLQAELHYRVSLETTRFTILLNNMQLIAILDWWKIVLGFLRSKIDVPAKFTVPKTNAAKSSLSSKFAILSSGVATRRGPAHNLQELPFEFKINVTETGIVVVENSQAWDTNAVILQSTAVVTYCPLNQDKPLSSSFQRLEVFSCILGLEDDTSLSIIDPVTINMDVVSRYNHGYSAGLLDVTDNNIYHILEVSTQDFIMRFSYHDVKLFLRIMEALSSHIPFLNNKNESCDATSNMTTLTNYTSEYVTGQDVTYDNNIGPLEAMGFFRQDCQKALEACEGHLDEAAIWLTQNACHASTYYKSNIDPAQIHDSNWFSLQAVEFHATNICVCLIDDCKDSDVPLVEITLSDLKFEHKFNTTGKNGISHLVLSLDFYNRNFSGWEPLLEPWECTLNWSIPHVVNPNMHRVSLEIKSEEIANFNVTSSLIDIWSNVKTNWTEDYYKQGKQTGNHALTTDVNATEKQCSEDKLPSVSSCKRRSPFVPFAIQNLTGCNLKFATITVNSDRIVSMDYENSGAVLLKQDQRWINVSNGTIVPFEFEGRVKMRHQNTHELKVHQLIVWIEGWHQIVPVSVDKVGVFFRHTKPQTSTLAGLHSERHIARVVFAITLEGSAQKLVTVRSALVLVNNLESMLDVKLENNDLQSEACTVYLPQSTVFPVPLPFVSSKMYVRPVDISGVQSYSEPIQWQQVERPGEVQETSYCSKSMSARVNTHDYRFCAKVRRENYPIDEAILKMKGGLAFQPAHVITFVPPVILVNLLPCELSYELCCFKDARGQIKPGGNASIHSADLSSTFEIKFLFDSFHVMNNLRVPVGSSGFNAVIHTADEKDRKLLLNVKAIGHQGGAALKIYIYAPYWIINKTGLPLIFRQDHAQHEAAGQTLANEMARSVAPLPFSFSETEIPEWCSMRVGKSVHPDGEPVWCHYFHLQKGVQVRRLTVLSRCSRPDWIYSIGIEIRPGRGKYRDVYFVTLTPRFHLKNHSSHSLEFTQKYAVNHTDLDGVRLSAMPKCILPFHWPRLDHEQLLCVRLSDVRNCRWSGGFQIDKINSLHINIRDENDKPIFIRTEIVLQGATFFVVFTDADNMPPPFRLDNMSEVPISCHQSSITEERKRISVRPHTSIPYALDEPTSKPEVTCIAPGGSTATYNLSVLGNAKQQLSYENFIYICFTETFSMNDNVIPRITSPADRYQARELVLDVPEGLKVVLNTKEPGKRSQLWRMTSTGKLIHEGSRPPQKTRKHSSNSATSDLVLDIADIVALPDKYVGLRLRKADPRRNITQTWEFSEDGRLRCQLNNLYVQSKDGFHGLVANNEAVLGPSLPVIFMVSPKGIPVEQCVSRQRLWPGSGLLGVKIINDGPTRVLSVSDLGQKSVAVEETLSSASYKHGYASNLEDHNANHLRVTVCLPQGIGISLVNSVPEELIYTRFKNITIEFIKSPTETSIDGSIQDLQVDNQLREQECPTMLYVSPMNKHEHKRHLPAVRFQSCRTPSRHANVDIFKYFIVSVKHLTLNIEERLLWTLLQFIGYDDNSQTVNDSSHETQRILKAASIALAKRYYFGTINLSLDQIRLSVYTSSKLNKELKAIKRRIGLTLINFEDAFVELAPYNQTHVFETFQLLMDSIVQHYKDKLKSQAAKILGAVDFLGNPLGLVNDVSEGISGFINDGNVGGLLKNVTHGLSNSAAKVTETLSEGLGIVTMDERHEQTRRKLRTEHRGRGSEQLVAGVKGLGFGIIGGITSIVTQTYNGAYSDGVPGFFSGFGKGLVGTFTKPAAGVLDLATSAASAVRDTSRSNQHILPPQLRLRRVCVGPGGLLPKYSENHSKGQQLLYNLNDNDYSEMFIALEMLSHSKDGLCALVSSKKVYFLSKQYCIPTTNCVLPINLSDLCHCKKVNDYIGTKIACYLELTTKTSASMGNIGVHETQCRKPKVLCDDEAIAIKVSQQINYAKGLFDEMVHTLVEEDEQADE